MSGISARETTRSAKRMRPSDSGPRMAPPVLFRLPSVSAPAANISEEASANNASTMSAAAVAMSSAVATMPVPVAAPAPAATPTEQPHLQRAAAAIAEEKAAGQRLLNVLIVILLFAALVIITWVSLKTPSTNSGEIAAVGNDSALEQLGDLKVPEVHTGHAASAEELAHKTEASPAPADDLTSGLNLGNNQAVLPVTNPLPETSIAGLDSEVKDKPVAVELPTKTPSAQVQLRPPVPMGSGSRSLVQQTSPSNAEPLELELPATRARAETVSNPSNKAITSAPSPELLEETQASPQGDVSGADGSKADGSKADGSGTGKSRTATNTGASPSLWDGAQNVQNDSASGQAASTTSPGISAAPTTLTSGLLISDPLSASIQVPQSGLDQSSKPSTNASVFTKPNVAPSTNNTPAPSPNLSVTVGGGESEPYNLATPRSTSTPDFDSVATIQQYQNYAQQQRLTSDKSAGAPTSNAANATAPKEPINSFAIGAETPISGQRQVQNPYVKGPINTYVASGQVPAAVTGQPTGPYVPQATPSTMPSGQGPAMQMPNMQMPSAQVPGQMVNGPNAVPGSLPGYQMPPAGAQVTPNYSVPPRTQTVPNAYAQPGANYPNAAGYPSTSYPPPAYSTPAGYTPPNANVRPSVPTGYQGSASYPVSNPFPAGAPAPSLMGPTGFATAPSSDVMPPRPVMGTMGAATSLPNGIQ